MQSSFWLDKWKADQIGFHLSEAHPLLKKFYQQTFEELQDVFVPLCGKSVDLSFLHAQGVSVVGAELSPIAVADFFVEQFPEQEVCSKVLNGSLLAQQTASLILQSSVKNMRILIGDYFALEQSMIFSSAGSNKPSSVKGIYDRAALIALPDTMRPDYVKQLVNLIPTASMLLITLDYEQQIMNGPPFSVAQDEVERLFEFANIKVLSRKNIIDKEPRFKDKGLSAFYESVYHIQW